MKEDLWDCLLLEDLKEWCRKIREPVGGRKAELATRLSRRKVPINDLLKRDLGQICYSLSLLTTGTRDGLVQRLQGRLQYSQPPPLPTAWLSATQNVAEITQAMDNVTLCKGLRMDSGVPLPLAPPATVTGAHGSSPPSSGLAREVILTTKSLFDNFKVFWSHHASSQEDLDFTGNPIFYNQSGIYMGFRKAPNEDYHVAKYVGRSANVGACVTGEHEGLARCSVVLIHFTKWPAALEEIMLATFQFRNNINCKVRL